MFKALLSFLAFPSTVLVSLLLMAQSMPSPLPIFPWLIIGLLLALNAFFVSVEFSLVGVNKNMLEEQAKNGQNKAQTLLDILQSPSQQNRYIATAQLGINLVSLALGMYALHYLTQAILNSLASWFNVALDHGKVQVVFINAITVTD